MKSLTQITSIFLFTLILTSCSSVSDADKMYGIWEGSVEKNGDKRTITLELRKNNTFSLKDFTIFNSLGEPTMNFTYNGIMNEDGPWSISDETPWDDIIKLFSRDGNSEFTLNGETCPVKMINEVNSSGGFLQIAGRNQSSEDPVISGWYIDAQYFNSVFFKTINKAFGITELTEIKLIKKN